VHSWGFFQIYLNGALTIALFAFSLSRYISVEEVLIFGLVNGKPKQRHSTKQQEAVKEHNGTTFV